MELPLFKIEDFFCKWLYKAPYLLCVSDAETWDLKEILKLATPECLALWEGLSLGMAETQGLPFLRSEISKMYTSVKPEHVLATAGAEEAIFASILTLLKPGDEAIVFTPCYQSLKTLPAFFGAEVHAIPLNDQWRVDLNKLSETVNANTKVIILNFPHNPTGALLDQKTLDAIIQIAAKHGAYILNDEVYRFLEIDEGKRLAPIADCYDRGISISVMSKVFGLGGLRVGWIAATDAAFFNKVTKNKHYLSICNSGMSEVITTIALHAKETLLKRNRHIMLSNLKLLSGFFKQHPTLFEWKEPECGCIAFPKFHGDVELFTKRLVEDEGVLLLTGALYDYPKSHFRIGFGKKNVPEALARVENFIKRCYPN